MDILLQNVFVHTPEGTAFRVSATAASAGSAAATGSVAVTVADDGAGFSLGAPAGPGSTGLGLSIAARLARASGGSLEVDADHGTAVTLELGPAA